MDKKPTKRQKKEHDFAINAFRVVQEATHEAQPNDAKPKATRTAAGKLGGLKGGKARAAKLSPERRRDIAKNAAAKRWQQDGQDSGRPAP